MDISDEITSLVDRFADPFFIVDRECRFLYLNASAERHFGRSNAELRGQVIWDAFPEVHFPNSVNREFQTALRDFQCRRFEAESAFKHNRWFDVHLYPYPNKLAVHLRDITESRFATEKLRKLQSVSDATLSHLRLDELLDDVVVRISSVLRADTVVILLSDGKLLCPRTVFGFNGHTDTDFCVQLGRGFSGGIAADRTCRIVHDIDQELSGVDPLYPALHNSGIRSLLGSPLCVGEKVVGVMHVGSYRVEHFSEADIHLIRLLADRVALAVEQSRLYEVVNEKRLSAESANRLKDDFLARVSHELRTPLQAIAGWTALLSSRRNIDVHTFEQAVETIKRNVEVQLRLIEDLLDVTRLRTGKLSLNPQPVDVASVVDAALASVEVAAEAKEIRISKSVTPALPQVWGDPDRLQQVIWNILSNAIKLTPFSGCVSIAAEKRDGSVAIIVKDTGSGIP